MKFRDLFIGSTLVLFVGLFTTSLLKKKGTESASVATVKKGSPADVVSRQTIDRAADKSLIERGERKDCIRRFFSKGLDRFPIVETVTYTSRVPWLKGRPAWIADYASYFQTSRHFIARSLNGKADYFTQNISPGDKFNVFRLDKDVQFYLLVDLASCTMDFYYLDRDNNERVFVKSYLVGVGRDDAYSPSGSLTPTGKYTLGGKVSIYKPGVQGFFQNRSVEMIEVFGTRWLPFEGELEHCSDSAKGYGIHGVPCKYDEAKNLFIEEDHGVGAHCSDGCIRLRKEDVEELFAIIITKPTTIEIVKEKKDAILPMLKENLLEGS